MSAAWPPTGRRPADPRTTRPPPSPRPRPGRRAGTAPARCRSPAAIPQRALPARPGPVSHPRPRSRSATIAHRPAKRDVTCGNIFSSSVNRWKSRCTLACAQPAPGTAPPGAGSSAGASRGANTSAGRRRVVPCTRRPGRGPATRPSARCRASARSRNGSPAKKFPCTNFTPFSTRGLSRGCRTRAGSATRPRAWAYSSHSRFSRGSSRSAFSTTGLRLSGTRTRNTPEKNSQASSQPAMTSSSVIENVR